MKRFSFFIASMLAAVTSWGAPEVKWITDVHDFGAFDENDGNVTCEFRFVNTGDEPLSVIAARATCGCTTPTYPHAPIEPGDTGTVTATYNPSGRPGRFSKKIYVDFNTEPTRSTLVIKGVVIGASNTLRSRYPEEAGKLKLRNNSVLFGKVKKGASKTVFFEVYNASDDTIVPQWSDLPPFIHISAANDSIPPGEQSSYSFFFVTNETDTYGIVTSAVTLTPDPANSRESFKIDVVGVVDENFRNMTDSQRAEAPVIDVSERSLDFDVMTRDGGKHTKKFTITNNGKSEMLVRRVYSVDQGVTTTVSDTTVKPGKTATVTVTVDPTLITEDILDARVTVIVNDPEHPTTVLRAVGQIK